MTLREQISVEFQGRSIGLKELSAITGLSYMCLYFRFQVGDTDERLVRPLETSMSVRASKRWARRAA